MKVNPFIFLLIGSFIGIVQLTNYELNTNKNSSAVTFNAIESMTARTANTMCIFALRSELITALSPRKAYLKLANETI